MTDLVAVSSRQEFTEHAKKLLACTTPTLRRITDPDTTEFRRSNRRGHLIQIDYNSSDFAADNVIRAVDLEDGTVILAIR